MQKLVYLIFLFILSGQSLMGMQEQPFETIEQKGEALFKHVWNSQDKLSPLGDGLGPMFNEKSCEACHPRGGSGDNRFNVQLLSLLDLKSGVTEKSTRKIPEKLNQLMPFFTLDGERTVILHKASTDEAYNHARRELLGLNPPSSLPKSREKIWKKMRERKQKKLPPTRVLKRYRDFELIVSERNTPALFGGGAIDRIPKSTLDAIAQKQALASDGISGRVSVALDGKVGRFGWRGQTSSLAKFVEGACAAELGLQSPKQPQNMNPFEVNTSMTGFDMSLEQLEQLNRFVASIERPVYKLESELAPAELLGKKVFQKLDCAKCHVEDLGEVRGLYSDLLLHDMGAGLADPLPALPELKFFEHQVFHQGGGYFGSGMFTITEKRRELTTNILQEWRTPPLWGVADSAPYLHDGRAQTLTQAILLHGGESIRSKQRFLQLSHQQKSALLAFLNSLTVNKRVEPQNPVGFFKP